MRVGKKSVILILKIDTKIDLILKIELILKAVCKCPI